MKIIHRNDSVHTPRTRDAAIQRLHRTSRWLLAGSVVLTGALTDVAVNAFPGHAKGKTARRAGASSRTHARHKPLAPPAAAPKPASTQQQQTTPPAAETSEAPRAEEQPAAETSAPEQSAPAPAREPAPAQETRAPAPEQETRAPAPESHESSPAPAEEPVVSGGS